MIVVVTGQPGAGKTLYTLQMVSEWAEREGRPVVYSGIKDLRLPWSELEDGAEWHTQPAKSIVVVDEAQRVFRPRATGAAVPRHVAELETHRHRGVDLVLVTQHPKLLDANVRRLVGRHLHVVRNFGLQRSTVHEWAELNDGCENGSGRKDSIRHEWSYPRELFKAYASAEVHTHKSRVPMRVWLLLLIPFVLAALGWFGWHAFKNASSVGIPKGGPAAGAVAAENQPGRSKVVTTAEYVNLRTARLVGLPQSAPIYDAVTTPVRAPYPAMCIAAADRCRCYTDQGTRVDVPESICRQFAERGFFVEWDQKPPERENRRELTPVSGEGGTGAGTRPRGELERAPQLGGVYGETPGDAKPNPFESLPSGVRAPTVSSGGLQR